MVRLVEADIITREVLDWKGVHVLHAPFSSCSQKLRIFLNLKGIEWQSHIVDVPAKQNLSPWYLGINPRGLVPVLVHNGAVHIESNDILVYLEQCFPTLRLIPQGMESQITELLHHEDDLHMDLRTLSFRFVFAPPGPPKTVEDLQRYTSIGSGTVQGKKDAAIDAEIAFWQRYLDEGGIGDDAVRASINKFRNEFEALEDRLDQQPYLMGENLTVLDIAWYIYANRLMLAGYPLQRLHPKVGAWFAGLHARPDFAKEVTFPPQAVERLAQVRRAHFEAGKALEQVADL